MWTAGLAPRALLPCAGEAARRNGGSLAGAGPVGQGSSRARGATSSGCAAGERIGARRRRRQEEAAGARGLAVRGGGRGRGGERDRDAEESGERKRREREEAVEGGE